MAFNFFNEIMMFLKTMKMSIIGYFLPYFHFIT